ncbi:hemerythrin domain-containing protein [Sphingomonas sp. CARO-RG-8B-R24-01]|uniref:hemerythrin domain-containing protein n=1 Tax=Sphingomonas sp. CARO-RG-8B-R24-01 TaxID=2914831 RepID=UPI001F57B9B4|nr:hemerythrin domain-containing protein [Sphingomonas sp. CARO-RG-8B-R24-01]
MAEDLDAWLLANRLGIPDTIAYLRKTYPSPTWREHHNFGELADFWLRVHASLREQGGQLQKITEAFREGTLDATTFQRTFVPRFNHFLQHLEGHHQIEDAAYFPKFRALDPRMQTGFDLLENDHQLIHGALLSALEHARLVVAALPRGADSVRSASDDYAVSTNRLMALLARHLADEEDLVIPAMLEHGERSVG